MRCSCTKQERLRYRDSRRGCAGDALRRPDFSGRHGRDGPDRRGRGSVRKDRGSLRIRLPDREARGARGGSSARGKDADGVAKAGSGGSRAVGLKNRHMT